jgi:hypothetical protein
VAAILFTVWLFCLTWTVFKVRTHHYVFFNDYATFTLACLIVFLVLCLNPFHFMYLQGRWQVAKTLGHILISPFGLVRFRHFFLADVMTSMTTPI